MRVLQTSVVTILAFFLCVGTISLTGCGKKGDGTSIGKVKAVEEVPVPSSAPITEERTYYDFEDTDLNGWEIPLWAAGKNDYVAKETVFAEGIASKRKW